MPKLATPIQYEDSLDELNQLRPMSLTDEGKIELAIPTLNVNPVDSGRPVIGKLLRCNQVGSLVGNSSIGYSNVEQFIHMFIMPPRHKLFEFSQKVFAVVIQGTEITGSADAIWTDSTYTATYATAIADASIVIPFVGDKLYIRADVIITGAYRVDVKGYY